MISQYKPIGWRWKYTNSNNVEVGGDVIFNLPVPEDIAKRAGLAEFSRTVEILYAESPVQIAQDEIEQYIAQADTIRALTEENRRLLKALKEIADSSMSSYLNANRMSSDLISIATTALIKGR